MEEYISKEKVKGFVRSGISTDTEADKEYVCAFIDSIPSADVRENIKGEWIGFDSDNEKYDDIMCSNCKHRFTVDSYRWCDIGFTADDLKYCPNCGADMREVEA